MGFQETRTDINICNRALSRIGQQTLSGSLSDPANLNKLAAKESNLWYKPIVRRLLEQHHWGIATKRLALTEVTNTRASEWVSAYAAPADLAFPVTISPYLNATSVVSYYRGVGALYAKLYGRALFQYDGNGKVLYGLVAGASLDYVSFNITEEDFTQQFEDLVVEFLSAALARSVAKDETMAARYEQQAIKNMNLAIAQNLNLQQPRYDQGPSEAELARAGIDPWVGGFTVPY